MTIIEFENRANYQNGYDRQFDNWKIIDIHQIPTHFDKKSEIDFYCYNGKEVYLLRFRNRNTASYEINNKGCPTYLIAEFSIQKIDNEIIQEVLNKFNIG